MRKWTFLFLILGLSGCVPAIQQAEPVEKMNSNNGWQVELCFEKDGYKVYRFSDGYSEWRYYVVPFGEMIDHVTTTDKHGTQTHPRNTRTLK